MSDQDHFLKRWSRRKLKADEPGEPAPPQQAEEKSPPDQTVAAADPVPSNNEPREPAFDLARLPSLDSIEAGTDITGFLKPGVPPELTRAALRRAWVADPAIRDFVGLSENSWDFNSGSIPGFGTISPEDVARLVSQLQQFASAAPAAPAEPVEAAPASKLPPPKTETAPPAPTQVAANERAAPAADKNDASVAPADGQTQSAPAPRHGRALPK
jgi:hypothetical protein